LGFKFIEKRSKSENKLIAETGRTKVTVRIKGGFFGVVSVATSDRIEIEDSTSGSRTIKVNPN